MKTLDYAITGPLVQQLNWSLCIIASLAAVQFQGDEAKRRKTELAEVSQVRRQSKSAACQQTITQILQ